MDIFCVSRSFYHPVFVTYFCELEECELIAYKIAFFVDTTS